MFILSLLCYIIFGSERHLALSMASSKTRRSCITCFILQLSCCYYGEADSIFFNFCSLWNILWSYYYHLKTVLIFFIPSPLILTIYFLSNSQLFKFGHFVGFPLIPTPRLLRTWERNLKLLNISPGAILLRYSFLSKSHSEG